MLSSDYYLKFEQKSFLNICFWIIGFKRIIDSISPSYIVENCLEIVWKTVFGRIGMLWFSGRFILYFFKTFENYAHFLCDDPPPDHFKNISGEINFHIFLYSIFLLDNCLNPENDHVPFNSIISTGVRGDSTTGRIQKEQNSLSFGWIYLMQKVQCKFNGLRHIGQAEHVAQYMDHLHETIWWSIPSSQAIKPT